MSFTGNESWLWQAVPSFYLRFAVDRSQRNGAPEQMTEKGTDTAFLCSEPPCCPFRNVCVSWNHMRNLPTVSLLNVFRSAAPFHVDPADQLAERTGEGDILEGVCY